MEVLDVEVVKVYVPAGTRAAFAEAAAKMEQAMSPEEFLAGVMQVIPGMVASTAGRALLAMIRPFAEDLCRSSSPPV